MALALLDGGQRMRNTQPVIPATMSFGISAVILVSVIGAVPARAKVRMDPRVLTVIEGLRIREQQLEEVSITFDFRAVRFPLAVAERDAGRARAPQLPPGEFMRSRITWARKGRKLLFDETRLREEDRRREHRVRRVYDGEKILSAFYGPSRTAKPSYAVHQDEETLNDIKLFMHHLSLKFWGRSVPDLLQTRARVQCLGYERLGGDRCLVLHLQDREQLRNPARLWIDLDHGFMLRKARRFGVDGRSVVYEQVASEPREWAPGFFLATRITDTRYAPMHDGKPPAPTHQWTVAVRSVIIGGLREEMFSATPREGQVAVDTRTGMLYGEKPRRVSEGELDAAAERARELLSASVIPAEYTLSSAQNRPLAPDPECGPQCLYVLCRNLSVRTTIDELRRLADTRETGTSLLGLERAARAKGLRAQGLRVPFSNVRQLRELVISLLRGRDHFYVLMGFNGRNAIILCPPDLVLAIPEEVLRPTWDERVLVVRR